MAGSGILRGFVILAAQLGIIAEGTGTYTILYTLAMSVFYFLPVLLGFSAGKRFGAVVPDNAILGAILALQEQSGDTPVVFVSKDINLRIKASIAGIASEDYENDRALDDFSLLYTGATLTPAGNVQRIGLATSPDLVTWTKQPGPIAGPDPRWYELLDGSAAVRCFSDSGGASCDWGHIELRDKQ